MSLNPPFEPEEWPLPSPRRESTVSSSTGSSGSAILLPSSPYHQPSPLSPATTLGSRSRQASLYDDFVRLPLTSPVTISFIRNHKMFKLKYAHIDICKDPTGTLKSLELAGGIGQQTPFIHTFHGAKIPVPHLEHPKLPNQPSLRISFLDEQTVQTAHTVFTTKLSYTFEDWNDCVQFQEFILGSKLVFIAGIAEAKSKGRGEECISQNIRILRGNHGKQVMLFFANSQRKELKRYVSIPLNCIETVNPGKKAGRPVALQLQPNFDILAEMKVLYIEFLDDQDRKGFCQFLTNQTL